MTEVRFYGHGLPGFKKKRLPGKLIVLEAADVQHAGNQVGQVGLQVEDGVRHQSEAKDAAEPGRVAPPAPGRGR